MIKMTNKIGRQKAHELLRQLSSAENFVKAVKSTDSITEFYSEEEIDEILNPKNYTGLAVKIIENMVETFSK